MSNYTESKKEIDAICQKYGCKGDIIVRTAIQYLMECGQDNFKNEAWLNKVIDDIDERHDAAEASGKWLFMTRDFEKAIVNCAKELASVNTYDLLIYIQREVWLGGGEVGEPDYQRAIEIIRNCLCYAADNFGAYPCENDVTLNDFREMGLTDEEIEYFGWSYLFDVEEEEE